MRRLFLTVTLLALLASSLWVAGASAQPIKFVAVLTGAAECSAPGVCGQGDPDGAGTAEITINPSHSQVCWKITVTNIALPAIGQHIHQAPVGVPGGIVVDLAPPVDTSGFSSGCTTASPSVIQGIIWHPARYYVNVHTTEFPAGAIRGQLARVV